MPMKTWTFQTRKVETGFFFIEKKYLVALNAMQVNCNTRARNTVDSSGSGVCRFGLSGHRDLDRMDRPLSKIKNVLSIVLYPHVAYFHCEIIWR